MEARTTALGIEEILRKNDEKRAHGRVRQDAYERDSNARSAFSQSVAAALIAAVQRMRDPAIGIPERLPIASKETEIGVFVECQGLVRFTLHCVVRTDQEGNAYCSAVDIGMSRPGGKIVRSSFDPVHGHSGTRASRLGIPEKHFGIDPARFVHAVEALAHQL